MRSAISFSRARRIFYKSLVTLVLCSMIIGCFVVKLLSGLPTPNLFVVLSTMTEYRLRHRLMVYGGHENSRTACNNVCGNLESQILRITLLVAFHFVLEDRGMGTFNLNTWGVNPLQFVLRVEHLFLTLPILFLPHAYVRPGVLRS